jgi:protein-S-isoprenylcysteine O-methyltransferase Ste14
MVIVMAKRRTLAAFAVWGFYLIIVLEFLFMISPLALYFYSAYGPALNLLHRSPSTAWLTAFFLPHFSQTKSLFLNELHEIGENVAFAGLLIFGIGAVQIYWAKIRRKSAVLGGLYAYIRHPQYLGLAVLGFGTMLIWPRFLVLVCYVTMLFLYVLLARWEEERCLDKYGEGYRSYQAQTGMFLPRSLIRWIPDILPKTGGKRLTAMLVSYAIAIGAAVGLGFELRNYSLSKISSLYSQNAAVLSPAVLTENELSGAYQLAAANSEVQQKLQSIEPSAKLIVYVIPSEWYLPDLPVEVRYKLGGHHTPKNFDRRYYKVLFTQARTHFHELAGKDIVKWAYGRNSLVLVRVNIAPASVTAVEPPPAYVVWGDIPTPMF